MKQQTSPAIVLRRTNYGEADRIVTFLTPIGKIKAIVKGVRRSKSKLAGGIELFSVSTITFLETRGDLSRVISSRLDEHWDGLVGDLPRMMFGYEVMKLIDKIVDHEADRDYFELLKSTLSQLGDQTNSAQAIELWFYCQILLLAGQEPNLKTDVKGQKLQADALYMFSADDMCFVANNHGNFTPEHIKLLRLSFTQPLTTVLQIKMVDDLAKPLLPIFKTLGIAAYH